MRIKKFNESKTELDTEYLNFVFSDFIDDGAADTQSDEIDGRKYWQIYLEEPFIDLKFKSIDNYINNINEINEFSKKLESCFNRLDEDNLDYDIVCEEIIDENGHFIFSGIEYMPDKIRRIIIITFTE